MAEEKREFKQPKNHVGYVSKSKAGNIMITVEQDLVLKKGDKLMHKKPSEEIDGLVERGFITEDQGEQRKEKVPEWKLYVVSVLRSDDK